MPHVKFRKLLQMPCSAIKLTAAVAARKITLTWHLAAWPPFLFHVNFLMAACISPGVTGRIGYTHAKWTPSRIMFFVSFVLLEVPTLSCLSRAQ